MANILYNPPRINKKKPLLDPTDNKGKLLSQSTLLFHPDKNEREYRGQLEYSDGFWYGKTLWGKKESCGSHSKTVYEGPSEHRAKEAVEEMLRSKVLSGYRGKRESNPYRWVNIKSS